MPIARFQMPDGRIARFEVPEGTTPEQAQSLIQTQLPSIGAAQQPSEWDSEAPLPESGIPGPRTTPAWAQEYPRAYETAVTARQMLGPTAEALGATLGGMAGAPMGPIGGVAGAGLGYGMAKQGLRQADIALGLAQPEGLPAEARRAAEDVATGATYEAGGQLIGAGLGKAAGMLSERFGAQAKAAKIAKEALGPDFDKVKAALESARNQPVSAAQATADINAPVWQSLLAKAAERDPRFFNALQQSQGEVSLNALTNLVGGRTATEARAATDVAQQTLRDITSPARQASLARANQGQRVAALEAEAAQQGAAASAEVDKVRRLMGAKQVAEEAAGRVYPVLGMPAAPPRYTYPGELAKKADEWASRAAEGSLDLGQGARFAQSAADSLREAGIQPLKPDAVISNLRGLAKDPEFAGNDVVTTAINNVARDIAQWTDNAGIIDAKALDAIRKNSVTAAVRDLMKGADPNTQRKAAAEAMSVIGPKITDAIENAGGVGYRTYLEDYAKGMQEIAQTKLTGKALDLWKNSPDAFVKLVQGEDPKTVEKFLGKGNYDIAAQLSDHTMDVLRREANKVLTNKAATEQAEKGQTVLADLLKQNLSLFRLPAFLSRIVSATNETLSELEKQIGKKTMDALVQASRSPGAASDLLSGLSAKEAARVKGVLMSTLTLPGAPTGAVAGTVSSFTPPTNNLAPNQPQQNALAR